MTWNTLQRAATGMLLAGGSVAVVAAGLPLFRPALAAPRLPYPQAVANSDVAARAVLARAGRETCLRGKLTRALLNLSYSCEASGTHNPLCDLADKAIVVTPMSLSFMDDTARQLLKLIHPDPGTEAAQASAQPSAAAEPASPAQP